jgi:hypothetical protein
MIKLTLTSVLLTVTFFVSGQDPKVSKKKENTRNGKATYYVLQSDPTKYHGKYTVIAWTGNEKIVEGNYSFGKREGLWTERYYGVGNKRGPRSNGQYKDNLKTGKWIYFSISGDTSQIYDYSTNELIFTNECKSTRQYNTKTESGYKRITLDCPPIFKGGKDILTTDLSQHISYYPAQLKAIGMHTFEINTELILTIDTTLAVIGSGQMRYTTILFLLLSISSCGQGTLTDQREKERLGIESQITTDKLIILKRW